VFFLADYRMRHSISSLLLALIHDDGGQDLIEYALLGGFVSLIVVAVVINLGTTVNGIYGSIQTQVGTIPGP
jgi:Flp pilus assembly pilin Flp